MPGIVKWFLFYSPDSASTPTYWKEQWVLGDLSWLPGPSATWLQWFVVGGKGVGQESKKLEMVNYYRF